jgi:transcriptional regulator with XRE-family HTH domain
MTIIDTVDVVPETIRIRRVARKLTITEAARYAGLGRSTYHMIEKGERGVTMIELRRIAGMLRTKPGELQREVRL